MIGLISEDIVIWNGVITKFGNISHLVEKDDEVKVATEEEVDFYHANQRWYDKHAGKSAVLNRIKAMIRQNRTGVTHFRIQPFLESTAAKWIPTDWIQHPQTSFGIELLNYDKMVACSCIGENDFGFPLNEQIEADKMLNLEL